MYRSWSRLLINGKSQRLKRAAHITQMPRWEEVAPTESEATWQRLDNAGNITLLEYYKHGDLLQFIGKLIAGDAVIQDKHGIKIFSCRTVPLMS